METKKTDEFPAGSVEIPYGENPYASNPNFSDERYKKFEWHALDIYVAKQIIKDRSFPDLKGAIEFANAITYSEVNSIVQSFCAHPLDVNLNDIKSLLITAFLNKASGNISPNARLAALDTRMNNIDIALETHPKFQHLGLEIEDLRREVQDLKNELKRSRVEAEEKKE